MLSIGVMAQGQSAYYLDLAKKDYYMDGGEPSGVWHGKGAELLGLFGQVEGSALNHLFEGYHPSGDKPLVEIQGKKGHRPGWDLTFSAPKSVSALWSQADEKTRRAIEQAHFGAVKAALSYLEDSCEVARRGKGGHEHQTARLIFATFEHGTSRAQDPQLHTHSLCMNLGVREDGSFGTLDAKAIYQSKMTAGALYRAELARGLEEDIGLTVKRQGRSFEIEGVPKKICDWFSKRRAEIEETLKEKGLSSPEAAAVAALSTRSVKGHTAREELFPRWQAEAKAQDWGQEEAMKLVSTPRPTTQAEKARGIRWTLDQAAAEITEHQSYFTEREMIRHMSEAAPGRKIGAVEILEGTDKYLNDNPNIVPLGKLSGVSHYTTREIMELEKGVLESVEKSREAHSVGVRGRTFADVSASQEHFSEEQKRALWHITQPGGGSIRLVSGMAGTGKTTLLKAARECWEREGYEVLGTALAGKASKGLQDGTGIDSDTIFQIFRDFDEGRRGLHSGAVMVVDEAGMVGTRDMARLVEETQQAGATLVLVGDARQLQPINAGGLFPEMEERLGAATLTEIRRQREEWARDAVKDFADGKAATGLGAHLSRGLLHMSQDRDNAKKELIKQWRVGGIHAPEDQLIFTGTREDAADLNRMAQAERMEAHAVSGDGLQIGGETSFYRGDRILFTRKSKRIGVVNGSLGEIMGINSDDGIFSVKLDSGERVSVESRTFDHFQLGYAMTTHKGQGATVEKAFILVGGVMQDREISYVQASRARGETRIFSDAETSGRGSYLAWQMSQSRAKESAHALAERARLTGKGKRPRACRASATRWARETAGAKSFDRVLTTIN